MPEHDHDLDTWCYDDCPGHVAYEFPNLDSAADVVDYGTRHVDQHDCAANHCRPHDNGIRSDDQHDAEHNLDRAIAQYLNDRRNPNLTDDQYHAAVRALFVAADDVLRHPARNRG